MTQLEKVLSMFNFKVPIIENDKLKKIKILGKGLNGSVYLEKYNQKFITSKVQPNFSDAPNFITINEKMICSNTQINELIISHFLTHLIKESYIHKFLGYKITHYKNSINIIKFK